MPARGPVPQYKKPSVKQCALVGLFLHQWLFIEAAVTALIVRLLRMPDIQNQILGPNVDFKRKLNILRVAATHSVRLQAKHKTDAVLALVTSAASLYKDRNNICHYPWHGTDSGKIFIARTKAVDSIVDARVEWTDKQLQWKVKESDRVFRELWAIKEAIKPVPYDEDAETLAALLTKLGEFQQDNGKESEQDS